MNRSPERLRHSNKLRFSKILLLLPFVTAGVVAGSVLPANADRTRFCDSNYSVVRDRSDMEAPVLPRRSVARCARAYQTLDNTYRVRPTSDGVDSENSSDRRSEQPNANENSVTSTSVTPTEPEQ